MNNIIDQILGAGKDLCASEVKLVFSVFQMAHLRAMVFVLSNPDAEYKASTLMTIYQFQFLTEIKNELELNSKIYSQQIHDLFASELQPMLDKNPMSGFEN